MRRSLCLARAGCFGFPHATVKNIFKLALKAHHKQSPASAARPSPASCIGAAAPTGLLASNIATSAIFFPLRAELLRHFRARAIRRMNRPRRKVRPLGLDGADFLDVEGRDSLHRRMLDLATVEPLRLRAVPTWTGWSSPRSDRGNFVVKQHTAIRAMNAKEGLARPFRLDRHEWGPWRRPQPSCWMVAGELRRWWAPGKAWQAADFCPAGTFDLREQAHRHERMAAQFKKIIVDAHALNPSTRAQIAASSCSSGVRGLDHGTRIGRWN